MALSKNADVFEVCMIHYGKHASTGILLSLKTEVKRWYAFA